MGENPLYVVEERTGRVVDAENKSEEGDLSVILSTLEPDIDILEVSAASNHN